MITSEQSEATILDQTNGKQLAELTLELIGPELRGRPTKAFVAGFCSWIRKKLLDAPEQPPELGRVAARVAGRLAADECCDLYKDAELAAIESTEAFIEQVAARSGLSCHISRQPPAAAEPEPIRRLGATAITYGEFNGSTFDEIPVYRLDWYLARAEENAAELRAYLNHPELQSWRRGNDR